MLVNERHPLVINVFKEKGGWRAKLGERNADSELCGVSSDDPTKAVTMLMERLSAELNAVRGWHGYVTNVDTSALSLISGVKHGE